MTIEFKTVQLKLNDIKSYRYTDYTDGYQRPIDWKKVHEIKGEFQPINVRDIIVAYRDKKYYVVDGQHTIEILKLMGFDSYTSRVFHSPGIEFESVLYTSLNTPGNAKGKTMNSFDIFKGRLAAKNKPALAINEIFEYHGIKLVGGKVSTLDTAAITGTLNSIKTQEKIKRVKFIVDLIIKIWPCDENRWSTDLFRGFLDNHNVILNCDQQKLYKFLSKKTVETVLEECDDLAHKHFKSRPMFGLTYYFDKYSNRLN